MKMTFEHDDVLTTVTVTKRPGYSTDQFHIRAEVWWGDVLLADGYDINYQRAGTAFLGWRGLVERVLDEAWQFAKASDFRKGSVYLGILECQQNLLDVPSAV